MRSRFRSQYAFDLALAKGFGVFGHALGDAVAHERSGRCAAGRDAHPAADGGGADKGQPVLGQRLPGLPHHFGVEPGRLAFEGQAFFHGEQDLTNAEQTDHRDQEVKALEQYGELIGHAQLAGHGVHAHGGQRKAQHHGHDDLGRRFLAHANKAAKGEQLNRKVFGRPEVERKFGQHRRQKGDQRDGKKCANERGGESRRQRLGGFALLRHRVAVKGGGDRPGFAWDIEQNRGNCPPEQGTPVNTRQHDDRRRGVHGEGQRQQNRNAVGSAQSGQYANQHAQRDADQHVHDVGQRHGDGKAAHEVVDFFH